MQQCVVADDNSASAHAPLQPAARSAAVFCRVSPNRLLLLTGDSGEPGHRFGDVWQLAVDMSDAAAGGKQHNSKWTQLQPADLVHAMVPRSNAAAAVVGGRYVVVFGGWDCSAATPLTALAVLDLSTVSWIIMSDQKTASKGDVPTSQSSSHRGGDLMLANGPPARGQPSLAAYTDASTLLLFGGWDGQQRFNDLWSLDVDTWQWKLLQPAGASPPPRADHSGVMWRYCDCGHWKDILVVFGGSTVDGLLNDVWLYDVDTATWRQAHCGGQQPTPRSSHAAAIIKGCMLISGGRTADSLANDLWTLDLTTLTWRLSLPQSPALPQLCRHAIAATGSVAMAGPPDEAAVVIDGMATSHCLLPACSTEPESDEILSTVLGDSVSFDNHSEVETATCTTVSASQSSVGPIEHGSAAAVSGTSDDPNAQTADKSASADTNEKPALWLFGGFDGSITTGKLIQLHLPATLTGDGDSCAGNGEDTNKVAQAPLQISDLEDADAVLNMPGWKQIRRLHTTAVKAKMDQYIDPPSGYSCWTAHYLAQRPCCGNACRHCPYGHANVVKA